MKDHSIKAVYPLNRMTEVQRSEMEGTEAGKTDCFLAEASWMPIGSNSYKLFSPQAKHWKKQEKYVT